MREAVGRREAATLLKLMLVINRASGGSEEDWQELHRRLETEAMAGLEKIEPPARDPRRPPPRPRQFGNQKKS